MCVLKSLETGNNSIFKNGSEKVFQMPDGSYIYHLNTHETNLTFQEIFIEDVYFKHNLNLPQNSYIFDIGANIGLFSIQAKIKYPKSYVFSFEPSPELYKLLFLNTKKFYSTVKTFQCGISDYNKKVSFYYFPDYSIMSSFFQKTIVDEQIIQTGIKNNSKTSNKNSKIISKRLLENFKKLNCQTISLSYFIRGKGIHKIDLLKVDVENLEWIFLKALINKTEKNVINIITKSHR